MLFDNFFNEKTNLLPHDGEVYYFGKILPTEDAERYFKWLMENILWQPDEAVIFGKLIYTKRKVAWYGDENFDYTYSKRKKTAHLWTPELLELKSLCEEKTGESYNSCLLNLYHDGSEGMAWHSDGEKDLAKRGPIASLSLGEERKFSFKNKDTKEKVDLLLEHGSLLLMTGCTQEYWLHRLPPSKKISGARINLTFRQIVR